MQSTMTEQLQEVAKSRHEDVSQIIAEAVEIGLKKIWLDHVLNRYLKKNISRQKTIELVGLDAIKLCEHQDEAVQDDISWGLKSAKHPS